MSHGLATAPACLTFATVLDPLIHIGAGAQLPTGQIDGRLRAGAKVQG